jgi:CRP/FNR family transcriptional regulator
MSRAYVPIADHAPAARAQVACAACGFNEMCHPASAPPGAPSPVEARRRLAPGEELFHAGERAPSLYAVHAGFLKIRMPLPGGDRRTVRYLFPGDVAGLDAFATGVHRSDAIAHGDCEVCAIPVYRLEILADFNPRICAQLRRLFSGDLDAWQRQAAVLAGFSAEQRIASFLLDTGRRWRERGFSGEAFQLPMNRAEMAEPLGLTHETVSRVLSSFRARDWIELEGGALCILDAAALQGVLAPAEIRT